MSYGLIYTIPFASLRKEACVVEIEKESYTGGATELVGAESPFEVEVEDDDFLYIPTRFSTATIRVVGGDYLQQLYSTSYQQYRVIFKRGGVVTWIGFIKPEIYTQDYSSDKFELEIECQSAMSVLEYINYKQSGTDGRIFVSLWDLIKKCVELSRGQYSAVYIPHVYGKNKASYDAGSNVLSEMSISEQNFFDEDDKAMKLKEVLEEICKLLGWTCIDYLGSLYFVDADCDGNYHRYDIFNNWDSYTTVTPTEVLNVQRIGFAGADHTYDRLNGYSKVTVKTSNYPIGTLLPDEDFNALKTAAFPNDVTEDKKVSHKTILLPSLWDMRQYVEDESGEGVNSVSREWVQKNKDRANMLMGALPIKFCEYSLNDDLTPSITNYNYENAIQVRWTTKEPPQYLSTSMDFEPVIVIKGASATYSDGAFSISGEFRHCVNRELGVVGGTYKWYSNPKIRCTLRIGECWYDGENWTDRENVGGGYFFVEFKKSEGETTWFSTKDTKTLDMPYAGLTGYIIPIKNRVISGDLELTVFASYTHASGSITDLHEYGYFLKDFNFLYQKEDFSNDTADNSDRYYENIVNESYINELDEIEFKISSYNKDGACYSKVLLGDNYLTNNLYSAIVDKAIRPEEHLIQRIVNRYDATCTKLTQVVKETPDLTPLTKLSDNFMVGKIFMPIGGSIDYKMGQYKCVMVEV